MTSTYQQTNPATASKPPSIAASDETQVQALARYAARATFDDLSAESRKQLRVHILDCLACSISALGAGPVSACRDQVRDFGGGHGLTLIGGGEANPVYAAFWHTVLVRYVDFMDNFLAPTETCHTADNFGVALTAAELAEGSGRDLMLGVALGYTVQSRLVDHGNFMTRGFDHTAQLAFSHNAAAGRLLGMTEAEIANAIAMAASSDAAFAVIRAKPLSQWKGIASAQSALGAMNALFLARRGVQGPLRVVEGPLGLDHLLGRPLRVDWDAEGYEGVVSSTIKKYNAQIHTQSAVYCMIELATANHPRLDVAAGFDPSHDRLDRRRGAADHLRLHRRRAVRYRVGRDLEGTSRPRPALPARRGAARRERNASSVHRRPRHEPGRPVAAKESVRTAERHLHRAVPAPHAGEDHRAPEGRHHARARGTGLSGDAVAALHLERRRSRSSTSSPPIAWTATSRTKSKTRSTRSSTSRSAT